MIAIFYILVVAVTVVSQSTATEYFNEWTGARPDAMLLVTLYLGTHRGREVGLIGGFFLGLLQDSLSGGLLGANALSKGLIGYATGSPGRNVVGRNLVLRGVLGLFATVFDVLLAAALAAIFLSNLPLPTDYWWAGAKTVALNALLAPIVIGLLARAEARVLPSAAGTPYPDRV